MIGKEYEEYWKQQKKIMEDGEKLIQHLKNQNIIEDKKIENVSRHIVQLAEVRESVKEKEKELVSKRSEYESVEEKELVLKVMAEQKMVDAETETEREWAKLLMEDEEKKESYQDVLNVLSGKVRNQNNLENISDDNVKALYQACFTVEAMLAFDSLGDAAKHRFEIQTENKKKSSNARGFFVQAIQNERELKKIACKYGDVIPDFSQIEYTIQQKNIEIREKEDEIKNLEREIKDDNSEHNQKYKKRLEELSIKGNEQRKQHSLLEERFHGIEREISTLMDDIKESAQRREEFERKRDLIQQTLEGYDELIQTEKEHLETWAWRAEYRENLPDDEREKADKGVLASLEEELSVRGETLAKMEEKKHDRKAEEEAYIVSIQNMEKKQREAKEKLEAKCLEKEKVQQELYQVEEAYEANNADIETLKEQYKKEEEGLTLQWEAQKQQLEELKEQSERMEMAKSDMNTQLLTSELNTKEAFKFEAKTRENRDPKEIDNREMYRNMANKVKIACRKFLTFEGDNKKDGHSNSDQFKGMMDQLDRIQKLGDEESLNMETYLDQLRQAAVTYKEAKNSQWFHFFPSNMRITRLAMADGLIAYCDQMKKQYELLGKMTGQVQPLPSATSNWKKFDKLMELNRKAHINPDNVSEKIKKLGYKKLNDYVTEQREKEEAGKMRDSLVDQPKYSDDEQELDNSVDIVSMNNV